MMNIEKELKVMLTEAQYERLSKEFEWEHTIEQRNHYFRCRNTKLFSSIRVRQIGERFFLQVKMPVSEEGALSVKKEFEKELSAVPPVLSAEELKELTGAYFGDAVGMGELFTLRKTAVIESCEVCLDKSEYLGITDFEIELEYTGEYPTELVGRIEALGICFDKPPVGKYARFIDAYKNNA